MEKLIDNSIIRRACLSAMPVDLFFSKKNTNLMSYEVSGGMPLRAV